MFNICVATLHYIPITILAIIFIFSSETPPKGIRLLNSNVYFGGVPSHEDAALAIQPQFAGCIGDATLNDVIVNFGTLTDTPSAVVGKCLLDSPFNTTNRRPLPPPPPIVDRGNLVYFFLCHFHSFIFSVL